MRFSKSVAFQLTHDSHHSFEYYCQATRFIRLRLLYITRTGIVIGSYDPCYDPCQPVTLSIGCKVGRAWDGRWALF